MDSDSIYTTNNPAIVEHAKYCYKNYPTVVNSIPPTKNVYDSSLKSYAEVDDKLSSSQLAIGQSSNLAQLCLTYSYNFDDKVYKDNVDILAVIAQLAIDSAKKSFDIDLPGEIDRISKEINVEKNGLPLFWQITKKDKRKSRTDEERKDKIRKNKEKIRKKINKDLVCPMNEIYKLKLNEYKPSTSTLPISEFFINNQQDNNRRKSKKVEEFIEKYSNR